MDPKSYPHSKISLVSTADKAKMPKSDQGLGIAVLVIVFILFVATFYLTTTFLITSFSDFSQSLSQNISSGSSNTPLTNEENVILQMAADRLSGKTTLSDFEIPESYYPLFSIRLIPINNFDSVNLEDMCVLIKSKFRFGCLVDSAMTIPDQQILDGERGQYDAGKIVTILDDHFPDVIQEDFFPIGITDKDMYEGSSNFIFSLQDYSNRIGVVSSYRFEESLPKIEDQEILLGRRVGIQLISTIGQLADLDRPTNSVCPLAYPASIYDFSKKGSKLCPETKAGVEGFISPVEEWLVPFTEEDKAEIKRVYEKYYFD